MDQRLGSVRNGVEVAGGRHDFWCAWGIPRSVGLEEIK
jgi:hypothetical protein